jgi:predicted dithiol-disulfide oxidoreductase (DUF899 family)
MQTNTPDKNSLPEVVSELEWKKALDKLLEKEKAVTRANAEAAAERRRLPMVRIDKNYIFEGPSGAVSLLDLFDGRRQLLLYHFMFAPTVDGWPDAGCTGCSFFADQICHLAHLHARDVSLCFVSLAPIQNIEKYRKRMGWNMLWVSSAQNDFNTDFGKSTKESEDAGLSVFLRDNDSVYRTYYPRGRGFELLGNVWSLLDLTPFGRQENWEDTPAGRSQSDEPYSWWRRHDEY